MNAPKTKIFIASIPFAATRTIEKVRLVREMKKQKSVTRVDKLTSVQRARFGEWVEKWIRVGLCTDPADRPAFEAAAAQCYRFAKLPPLKRIVWVKSPMALALAAPTAAAILDKRMQVSGAVHKVVDGAVSDAVDDAVGGAVSDAVDDAVGGAVRDAVDGAVGGAVRGAVGGAVDGAVHKVVDGAVSDAVDDAVGGAVDGAVRGAVGEIRSNWHHYIGGQFWVGGWWGSPSFVSFFREACLLQLDGEMDARAMAYEQTARSACWWWPHREFVMVSDRPRLIVLDDRGRLHSETGNAIEFRDGWGVAAWHGTVIPLEWLANRAALDPKIALTDPSVERRRAAAEIIGWNKILAQIPTTVIDTDDPQIGTLLSVDLPDAPGSRFLKVWCPTGRDFVLPVPAMMTTALAANSWTYDIPQVDFKKIEVRT